MMPEGWKLVEAQDVCKSISVGVVIKPTQYYVEAAEGVKAFRSANVREGFINDNDWVYFSHEGHSANKKSQLKAGDVLIVRTGYPGTACVVTPEFEGSNAIDIVIARPDMKQVVPEYLCAYTNSHIGKSQVLDLQGGMAQKHLNVGAYQVLKVKLPPLPEQKKIAQILSTWDKAITTTEQLLANSQQQKKALMQQLLTGKRRLLDKNGASFEREWRKLPFSDLVSLVKTKFDPKTNADDVRECIELEHITQVSSSLCGSTNTTDAVSAKTAFKEGDVLFGKLRPYLRKHWKADRQGVCSTEIWVFRAKDKVAADYICHVVQLDSFIEVANKSSGTHMPRADWNVLKDFLIPTPPLEEQQKIAAVLSIADHEISALQQKLNALKKEKKALMQQLLTGKRRLRC